MRINQYMINATNKMLTKYFDMKDMDITDVILGFKISRTSEIIVISQSHYVETVLRKFNAYDSSIVKTPMDECVHLGKNHGKPEFQLEYCRIIGSLMYITNCSRPDIAYAMNMLSRFINNLSDAHRKA